MEKINVSGFLSSTQLYVFMRFLWDIEPLITICYGSSKCSVCIIFYIQFSTRNCGSYKEIEESISLSNLNTKFFLRYSEKIDYLRSFPSQFVPFVFRHVVVRFRGRFSLEVGRQCGIFSLPFL